MNEILVTTVCTCTISSTLFLQHTERERKREGGETHSILSSILLPLLWTHFYLTLAHTTYTQSLPGEYREGVMIKKGGGRVCVANCDTSRLLFFESTEKNLTFVSGIANVTESFFKKRERREFTVLLPKMRTLVTRFTV